MGWIAGFVILIPLLIGIIWAISGVWAEKRSNAREVERIRRRLADKERNAKRTDETS